jgi:hypothetical protein
MIEQLQGAIMAWPLKTGTMISSLWQVKWHLQLWLDLRNRKSVADWNRECLTVSES